MDPSSPDNSNPVSRDSKDQLVAVVTGAASGLGAAYARRLARDGYAVAIADVAEASETVSAIERDGGRAWAGHCDVTSPRVIEEFEEELRARFGRWDALVNNAGIYPVKSLAETTLSDFRAVMSVNAEGVFNMTQALTPAMRDRGWGRVVNISSTTAWLAVPGFAAYVASKMAVIGLTRAFATELGDAGVTVNCVCPGLVRTATTEAGPQAQMFDTVAAMQAIKRTQVPADMEGVISFLCSEDSAFMTGQTVVADGGLIRL